MATATQATLTAEWIDEKNVIRIFGISRTPLYNLRKAGKIRSTSIKTDGASYGKRLYNVASIREFIAACEAKEPTHKGASCP